MTRFGTVPALVLLLATACGDETAISVPPDASSDMGSVDGGGEPVVLTGWRLEHFPLVDSTGPEALYEFSEDGLVATQTTNAFPSVYVNSEVLENVRVRARITVETTEDDDHIGFVFGWQDREHFYLLDWKEAAQSYPGCGTASEGVTLRRVDAAEPLVSCNDFWNDLGTEGVTVLSPASQNPDGWVPSVAYDLELVHKPGDLRIVIRRDGVEVASIASSDARYPRGAFGFYNYSQEAVRYELVTFESAL